MKRKIQILEVILWSMTEADFSLSKSIEAEREKELQNQEKLPESIQKILEDGWKYDEPLRRCLYFDDRPGIEKNRKLMKDAKTRAQGVKEEGREKLGTIAKKQSEVNFPCRKVLVEHLTGLLSSTPLKPKYDMVAVNRHLKDLGINRGFETIEIFVVDTNRVAVMEARNLISEFITTQCGATYDRNSGKNIHYLPRQDNGALRYSTLDEITKVIKELEEKINRFDFEKMKPMEMSRGMLESIRSTEGYVV